MLPIPIATARRAVHNTRNPLISLAHALLEIAIFRTMQRSIGNVLRARNHRPLNRARECLADDLATGGLRRPTVPARALPLVSDFCYFFAACPYYCHGYVAHCYNFSQEFFVEKFWSWIHRMHVTGLGCAGMAWDARGWRVTRCGGYDVGPWECSWECFQWHYVERFLGVGTLGRRGMAERTVSVLGDPDVFEDILEAVAGGGTLKECTDSLGISYRATRAWVYAEPMRMGKYEDAVEARNGAYRDLVLSQVAGAARASALRLFGDDGSTLRPSEIPADMAAAVVDVQAVPAIGELPASFKYKLADKLRGAELLGKTLTMFRDQVDVGVGGSLVDLLERAASGDDKQA